MRGRLGRYALWQARDFAIERAAAILFTGAAFVFLGREMFTAGSHALLARGGDEARRFGAVVIKGIVQLAWVVFPLLAARGIVADDRVQGRFRLLFAKPIRVPRFYAQLFILHGALTMLCAVLVVVATRLVVPLSGRTVGSTLAIFLASYLLVGGLIFLFSAIWRWDWLAAGVVITASMYLAGRFPEAAWLRILPPVWEIARQFGPLEAMEPLDWTLLVWAGAYGVACFLLGLLVLRQRPLGT